jgi:hypothetical protein
MTSLNKALKRSRRKKIRPPFRSPVPVWLNHDLHMPDGELDPDKLAKLSREDLKALGNSELGIVCLESWLGGFRFRSKTKRGPKRKWGPFELVMLWAQVQARMRAYKISLSSACMRLARPFSRPGPDGKPVRILGPVAFTGKALSKGRIEGYYYEAAKYLETDPEALKEAEQAADELAVNLKKRTSIT